MKRNIIIRRRSSSLSVRISRPVGGWLTGCTAVEPGASGGFAVTGGVELPLSAAATASSIADAAGCAAKTAIGRRSSDTLHHIRTDQREQVLIRNSIPRLQTTNGNQWFTLIGRKFGACSPRPCYPSLRAETEEFSRCWTVELNIEEVPWTRI